MTPAREQIEERLRFLTLAVRQAGSGIADGRRAEPAMLGDLERDVERLCGHIPALPGAQARAIQPALGELISALDTLAGQLEDMKSRMIHGG